MMRRATLTEHLFGCYSSYVTDPQPRFRSSASNNGRSRHAARVTTTAPAPTPAVLSGEPRQRPGTKPPAARQKAQRATRTMMNRHTTTTVVGRSSSMRRMRRRAAAANTATRPFCGTNGCPSFLEVDPATGIASCGICGFTRRTH
jgi:hypothetical protein